LRAPRANRVFVTDEKRIRNKNTVMDRSKDGLGVFSSKIADCERTGSSSARKRRSARTGRRPRKFEYHSSTGLASTDCVDKRTLRAPRANPVF
jgi:hypothetical protein